MFSHSFFNLLLLISKLIDFNFSLCSFGLFPSLSSFVMVVNCNKYQIHLLLLKNNIISLFHVDFNLVITVYSLFTCLSFFFLKVDMSSSRQLKLKVTDILTDKRMYARIIMPIIAIIIIH